MTVTNIDWAQAASGQFNVAGNWSPTLTPSASTDAYIEATGSSNYLVTSNTTVTVDGLYIGSQAGLLVSAGTMTINTFTDIIGAEIQVSSGATLAFGSAGQATFVLHNTGTLNLNGTSTKTASLRVTSPTVVLRDGGQVTMTGSHDAIAAGTTATTLVNIDNTIAGLGTIGSANLTLQNGKNGVIDANAGAALLLNTGSNTILNDGLIESTSTGGLTIDSGMFEDGLLLAGSSATNAAGTVTITNNADVGGAGDAKAEVSGSSFVLNNGMLTMGGTVSTVAGSAIKTAANTVDTLSSGNIQSAGTITVANGSTLQLNATIINTGTVSLSSSGTATTLKVFNTGITFDGTGSIVLSNNANNKIISDGTAQTLVNNGNTIRGAGTIGDADLRLVNRLGSTINANGSVGLTIVGDTPSSTLQSDYNVGIIEATGAGGLTMTGVWNDAGVIAAASSGSTLQLVNFTGNGGGGFVETTTAGAQIVLNNALLTSPILTTVAGSTVNIIDTASGTTNAITNGLTNAGQINLTNSTLTLANHLRNSGTIALTGSTSADVVTLTGNNFTTLQGGGQFTMGDTAGNSIVSDGAAEIFRNVDNTVSGFGTIGDTNMTVQNQIDGTINANTSRNLTITTGSNRIINAGTMETTSSGGVTINGSLYCAGTLAASSGDLSVSGAVTGIGIADISGSGTIEFGAVASLDTFFLAGTGTGGTLQFDHSSTAGDAYNGVIHGFAGADRIDVADIAYTPEATQLTYAAGATGGTLTLSNGSTSSTMSLAGSYSRSSFSIGSDSHSGTVITFAA